MNALRFFVTIVLISLVLNIYSQDDKISQLILGDKTAYYPQWSPDSKKILFYSEENNNYDIWVINADGKNLKRITNDSAQNINPTWHPNGKTIYFSSNRDENYNIYKITDINHPEHIQKITDTPENERWVRISPTKFAVYNPCDKDPKFRNYFREYHYKVVFTSDKVGMNNIWIMREDGTHKIRITDNLGNCLHPTWSRNSEFILFDLKKDGKNTIMAVYPPKLYIPDRILKKLPSAYPVNIPKKFLPRGEMGWNLGKVKIKIKVYNLGSNCSYPSVSGNGTKILFVKEINGKKKIFVYDIKNKQTHPINIPDKSISYAVWAPNGRYIAFTSNADESFIFKLKIDDFFSDIINIADFKFSKEQIEALKKNGFFISKEKMDRQFYYNYEKTDYKYRPVFITTDSVLHIIHILFDYLLWKIEKEYLYTYLYAITENLLNCSISDYQNNKNLKTESFDNIVFFGVAAKILGIKTPALPINATDIINQELALINEHNKNCISPALKRKIDYTQFIVRGHYDKSEIFKKYFKVMMWYAKANFELTDYNVKRMLLIYSYTRNKIGSENTNYELWNKIFNVTSFFIGSAEDITLNNLSSIIQKNFQNYFSKKMISNPTIISKIKKILSKLPNPKIAPNEGKSFRFIPQRYAPDAKIIQDLVFDGISPDVGTIEKPRLFAKGLDVMGVLGSARAYEISDTLYHQTDYYNYSSEFNKLRTEFDNIDNVTWNSNMYWNWLKIIKLLFTPNQNNPQKFLDFVTWKDKELMTALSAWVELKHDTILYTKQPFAAECGMPDMETFIPNIPSAYVEPNTKLYHNINILISNVSKQLDIMQLIDEEDSKTLKKLNSLISFLEQISLKEIKHIPVNSEENKKLQKYGAQLEHLTLSLANGEYKNLYEDDIAIVTDVQTAFDIGANKSYVLEEGIGRVHPIFVLLDIDNHRQINEGSTFSYYEFTVPASERLTDKKWRKMKKPQMPKWTESFVK